MKPILLGMYFKITYYLQLLGPNVNKCTFYGQKTQKSTKMAISHFVHFNFRLPIKMLLLPRYSIFWLKLSPTLQLWSL